MRADRRESSQGGVTARSSRSKGRQVVAVRWVILSSAWPMSWEARGLLRPVPAAVVALATPTWPPWALMWALAFAIYAGCKWLTWRQTPAPDAPKWRHVGYLLAWPGMDADAFLKRSSYSLPRPGA